MQIQVSAGSNMEPALAYATFNFWSWQWVFFSNRTKVYSLASSVHERNIDGEQYLKFPAASHVYRPVSPGRTIQSIITNWYSSARWWYRYFEWAKVYLILFFPYIVNVSSFSWRGLAYNTARIKVALVKQAIQPHLAFVLLWRHSQEVLAYCRVALCRELYLFKLLVTVKIQMRRFHSLRRMHCRIDMQYYSPER